MAWTIAGALLLGVAFLRLIGPAAPLPAALLALAAHVAWAGSLGLFALGFRRSGSVVARRPLGVVTLLIAAAAPLGFYVAGMLTPENDPLPIAFGYVIGYGERLVTGTALAVALVVVTRAGAVPRRFRGVPILAFAVVAGAQIVVEIAGVALADRDPMVLYGLVVVAGMTMSAALVLVGVLAILQAPRAGGIGGVVQVYPPP